MLHLCCVGCRCCSWSGSLHGANLPVPVSAGRENTRMFMYKRSTHVSCSGGERGSSGSETKYFILRRSPYLGTTKSAVLVEVRACSFLLQSPVNAGMYLDAQTVLC